MFLGKLKDIRIVFEREASEINKNVAKEPVSGKSLVLFNLFS